MEFWNKNNELLCNTYMFLNVYKQLRIFVGNVINSVILWVYNLFFIYCRERILLLYEIMSELCRYFDCNKMGNFVLFLIYNFRLLYLHFFFRKQARYIKWIKIKMQMLAFIMHKLFLRRRIKWINFG